MADLETARRLSLALPEVVEQPHFAAPSFRVRGKILATCGAESAVLKVPAARRLMLCEVDPTVFTPAVWGRIIWLRIALPSIDEPQLAELLVAAWREVAPKALRSRHPELASADGSSGLR